MNTAMMSSLLLAMLVAASVPVTAAERERSGANQRQQPQQQRVQQGAQQGNSARGEARQVQGQARDAGRERNGINQRQQNQQQRIQQGVRQGDITRGEGRQLQGQARDIRREEHAFRSDGRFTPAERQHVQRDLDRQSRDIRHERNDGQRRYGQDGRHTYAGYGGHGSTRAFDRRYDQAQHDQRQSIQRGIRSGELTRHEAGRLMDEQRRLEAQERRYLADGSLSRRERADMTQDLNRARQHIYNETHDAQERR